MDNIAKTLVIIEIFFTWIPVYLVDKIIKYNESKKGE